MMKYFKATSFFVWNFIVIENKILLNERVFSSNVIHVKIHELVIIQNEMVIKSIKIFINIIVIIEFISLRI
jgi:hypothetical protein